MPAFDWAATALFAGAVLLAALYGLSASGHFPAELREAGLRGGLGAIVLWSTMAVTALAGAAAVAAAWRALPWTAAVIGAGAAVLFAPLLLRPFPDRFVNGRAALALFSAGAALLAWARAG
jgi:hypothetical protein